MNKKNKNIITRKNRVRKKVRENTSCFRLTVFRSNKHIYAQVINDVESKTMVSASTKSKDIDLKKTSDKDAAAQVGKLIAKKALEAKIEKVCFDRGPYLYHGRVKALADAAREQGLQF